MDTKEYTAYQQSLKAYWDLSSSIQSSFELGVEKGMEKGIEQGMEIGLAQAKSDLIIKLHKSGMSAQEIENLTELSESEIQRLITPQ